MTPARPLSREGRAGLWRLLRLMRRDLLSALPERLYRASMAEFRLPFFRSYLVNDTGLVARILRHEPQQFPKSGRVTEGLTPLLGQSVFVTNGTAWERQRRIIDPAFDGGRMREVFPALMASGEAMVARLEEGVRDIEPEASHAAADAIFRTLFSMPIEAPQAERVFAGFSAYQRAQPVINLPALLKAPRWVPRGHRPAALRAARAIRADLDAMIEERLSDLARGRAPDDLATRLITARDPVTGTGFDRAEMLDQVAIFFLAGHETSAAALSWAAYLLAQHQEVQDAVAAEALAFLASPEPTRLTTLRLTRNVFREALRLYPPVPMMVREASVDTTFRNRPVRRGTPVVLSPWHLHRHPRHWDRPDSFDPDRWNNADAPRAAYLPFSAGPRACPGAGFAMMEGCLFLARLVAAFELHPVPGRIPVPVARLTVRGRDGIWLELKRRQPE